jgi:hypothetical protein
MNNLEKLMREKEKEYFKIVPDTKCFGESVDSYCARLKPTKSFLKQAIQEGYWLGQASFDKRINKLEKATKKLKKDLILPPHTRKETK